MKNTILFLIAVIAVSCNKITKVDAYHLPELQTHKDHQAFLDTIFKNDQEVRTNSKESAENIDLMNKVDAENLIKIRAYLNLHPYPSKELYDESASMTPILVIHHQPAKTNARQEFFPIFYKAYKTGDISPNFFSMYLGRWYYFTNGENHRMKSPYMMEDQIDTLIKELELQIPE